MVPKDGVSVEIKRGVEPEIDPLLLVTFTMGVHIGLNGVGLSRPVSQELKVQLIADVELV